jgi:hypothetical protein
MPVIQIDSTKGRNPSIFGKNVSMIENQPQANGDINCLLWLSESNPNDQIILIFCITLDLCALLMGIWFPRIYRVFSWISSIEARLTI